MAPSTYPSLLNDSRIIHIFSGHLDVNASEKISPIPLGVNPSEFPKIANSENYDGDFLVAHWKTSINFNFKKLQNMVVRVDRPRDGDQFAVRRQVASFCDKEWKSFCNSESANSTLAFN